MSDSQNFAAASPALRQPALRFALEAFKLIIEAMLGSLLGISTAALFGFSALVFFAEISPGVALTAVALAMNAMLFCLVLLGSLSDQQAP
ncbi:hypothetical protein N0B44_24945 [Roseibacterium beibuensis]|uniref:Uncharacterized protein n=1 Tax=[Roseibacterium] beibuensis TaxID=1193142 RepID=A0ABP9LJK6_9RHOB|nr:hypothetical protein [Roseibacterium beibuensis]MCS6626171.1 hypothetical protein [Roseibacterium beibuensis]